MADKEFITTDMVESRMKAINIVAKVESKGDVRDINLKAGGTTKVCPFVLTDPKGKCTLQLWGEEIDKVSVSDLVKITNGYVTEFKGDKSLNVGKFGNFEIVQQANA